MATIEYTNNTDQQADREPDLDPDPLYGMGIEDVFAAIEEYESEQRAHFEAEAALDAEYWARERDWLAQQRHDEYWR